MVDLSIVEAGLVGGGLVAIASAVYGRKESSSWDEVLLFLGFLVGAAMIGIGAWAWGIGEYDISTRLILIFLGLSLFLRAIKGIKLASLIALITGGAVGYGLYWLGKAFELEFLTSTVILVTAFLVLIIVYVIFKFVEDILDMGGVVLGFRSVQFLVGLVAFAEAVLLLLDRSLWYFLS